MTKVYREIASLVAAIENCQKSGNTIWEHNHRDRLVSICRECLPSGSGFDSGTAFDMLNSTPEKLVFRTSFHRMDENGCYDGWTEHNVIIRPSLAHEINVTVSGRDRNDIKDYIGQMFYESLTAEVPKEGV
jgi:hypothetical protein